MLEPGNPYSRDRQSGKWASGRKESRVGGDTLYEKGGMHGSAHTSSDGRSRGHRMQSTVRSDSVSKWPFLPCSIFRGSWQWREQPQLILWQQGGEERSVITVPAPGHTPAGIPFCYQMFSLPTCFPESLTCTVSHAFQGVLHVQSPHDFLGVSHVQSPHDFPGSLVH